MTFDLLWGGACNSEPLASHFLEGFHGCLCWAFRWETALPCWNLCLRRLKVILGTKGYHYKPRRASTICINGQNHRGGDSFQSGGALRLLRISSTLRHSPSKVGAPAHSSGYTDPQESLETDAGLVFRDYRKCTPLFIFFKVLLLNGKMRLRHLPPHLADGTVLIVVTWKHWEAELCGNGHPWVRKLQFSRKFDKCRFNTHCIGIEC